MSFVPNRDLKRLNPMSNDCFVQVFLVESEELWYHSSCLVRLVTCFKSDWEDTHHEKGHSSGIPPRESCLLNLRKHFRNWFYREGNQSWYLLQVPFFLHWQAHLRCWYWPRCEVQKETRCFRTEISSWSKPITGSIEITGGFYPPFFNLKIALPFDFIVDLL